MINYEKIIIGKTYMVYEDDIGEVYEDDIGEVYEDDIGEVEVLAKAIIGGAEYVWVKYPPNQHTLSLTKYLSEKPISREQAIEDIATKLSNLEVKPHMNDGIRNLLCYEITKLLQDIDNGKVK